MKLQYFRILINISLLIFVVSACVDPIPLPDPCPPDCPEPPYPLEIVWETFYYPQDTTQVLFNEEPKSYKNNFLMIAYDPVKTDHFHAFMFDKDSGLLQNVFDFGLNPPAMEVYDHYLIATALDGLYLYDLDTYELITHDTRSFQSKIEIDGNVAYLIELYGELPWSDSNVVYQYELPSLSRKRVLSVVKDNPHGYSNISGITSDIINGDTILYSTADVDFIFAYNMTKKEYVWTDRMQAKYDGYFDKPVVDDEHMYFTWHKEGQAGDDILYAYNKYTGTVAWEQQLEGFYRGNEPSLVDGYLYLREGSGYHLYRIEAKDGRIVWHSTDGSAGPGYNTHNKGLMYYVGSAGRLQVIDMKTGKVLTKLEGPYDKIDLEHLEESRKRFGSFSTAVPYIDKERNTIYIGDSKRMFCFKIPEEW